MDERRNFNPHKEARAAMWLFGKEYSESKLGSMNFFDSLLLNKKILCYDMVDGILKAKRRWNFKKGKKENK